MMNFAVIHFPVQVAFPSGQTVSLSIAEPAGSIWKTNRGPQKYLNFFHIQRAARTDTNSAIRIWINIVQCWDLYASFPVSLVVVQAQCRSLWSMNGLYICDMHSRRHQARGFFLKITMSHGQ